MAFEHAIVLTGGIATGKSTVSEIFMRYGVPIIDADQIAHQILSTQTKSIQQLFGEEYTNGSGVDRKALGALVFSDKEAKQKLEALLHPLIYKEIEGQSEQLDQRGKPYLADIPLFFETNRYPIEKSIIVYAPRNIQLKRLMQRNNFNEKEALARINAQMDIDQKRKLATHVIDNSHDLQALQRECDKIYKKLFSTPKGSHK